jgi:hypothetical protein
MKKAYPPKSDDENSTDYQTLDDYSVWFVN